MCLHALFLQAQSHIFKNCDMLLKSVDILKNKVAIVPAAGNILSVLLFRQSTRFLTIKHYQAQ